MYEVTIRVDVTFKKECQTLRIELSSSICVPCGLKEVFLQISLDKNYPNFTFC